MERTEPGENLGLEGERRRMQAQGVRAAIRGPENQRRKISNPKELTRVRTCLAAVVNASRAEKKQRGSERVRTERTSQNGGLIPNCRGMSWAFSSIQRSASKSLMFGPLLRGK